MAQDSPKASTEAQPFSARWVLLALLAAAACGGTSMPANPWKPGEADLVAVPGLCFGGVSPPSFGDTIGTFDDNCTYVGRDMNGDSAPGALMQWKVEPGIVPLTTIALDPIERVRIQFSAPATPGVLASALDVCEHIAAAVHADRLRRDGALSLARCRLPGGSRDKRSSLASDPRASMSC